MLSFGFCKITFQMVQSDLSVLNKLICFKVQLQEEAGAFQNHVQSFFTADTRSRSQPRPEKAEEDRRQRAVTPGRSLLGEISNLKPVQHRKSVAAVETETKACDFTKHFKVRTNCHCWLFH
jgi:hypothetical protein